METKKDYKLQSTNETNTSTANNNARKKESVSSDRKQSLLLEARRARVDWVDASTSFFLLEEATKDPISEKNKGKSWKEGGTDHGECLKIVSLCKACVVMKSGPEVVKTLYQGVMSPLEVQQRLNKQLSSQISTNEAKNILNIEDDDDTLRLLSPSTYTEATPQQQPISSNVTVPPIIQRAKAEYDTYITSLRSPESADLVLTMKSFVESFPQIPTTPTPSLSVETTQEQNKPRSILSLLQPTAKPSETTKETPSNTATPPKDNKSILEALASSIHTFLTTTTTSSSTPPPTPTTTTQDTPPQPLETFIYTKCYPTIWSYIRNEIPASQDQEFHYLLQSLHFIQLQHLEVPCFTSQNFTQTQIQQLFQSPIAYLDSLQKVYSPKNKLLCIYNAYKDILSILNSIPSTHTSFTQPSPPTADDIIPTFIYCLIQSQPNQILSNILFIEIFCLSNQVKGEMAYAFTHLQSAVHFLFSLKHHSNASMNYEGEEERHDALNISMQEFKRNLEVFKQNYQEVPDLSTTATAAAEQSIPQNSTPITHLTDASTAPSTSSTSDKAHPPLISLQAVRQARMQGQTIDLNWARRYTATQPPHTQPDTPSTPTESPTDTSIGRTYTFLGKQPSDIRIDDIPRLLEEYHDLIHVCENMILQRRAMEKNEKQRLVQMEREILESRCTDED